MIEIKKEDRTEKIIEQLVYIWQRSVIKTHTFLSFNEIEAIKKYVPAALKEVDTLIIETNAKNEPIAFMGTENKKLEILFIDPDYIQKGLGKKLIQHAICHYQVNEVTVNEDNINAKGFYEHMGFSVYKRSPLDEQGNPYPILYMKLNKKG